MLGKDTAQSLSKELKIDLFSIYREYLQLLFLKYFYGQKGSEKVYFKGGTALRFLQGSFRFSEDLDFTSLLTKDQLKTLIGKTLQDLKKEAEGVSFREAKSIADSFSGKISQKLPEFNFPLTIRLDFSTREKPVNVESYYLETVFPIGPYPQICHLKTEEMMAEKIRAILTRNRGRDIFDFWFMLSKKIPIDWELVNKKMALYKKTGDLEKLTQAIEKFPQEEIKNDLTKFLPFAQRNLVEKIKELTLEKLRAIAAKYDFNDLHK